MDNENEINVETAKKIDIISDNVVNEAEAIRDDKSFKTPVTKDPFTETTKYLLEKDVYEIFKGMTWKLVRNRPNDPIRNMINMLKLIQREKEERQIINEENIEILETNRTYVTLSDSNAEDFTKPLYRKDTNEPLNSSFDEE